jgi:ubiquinone/menaquinone biosynthesis C-methylase UbiE
MNVYNTKMLKNARTKKVYQTGYARNNTLINDCRLKKVLPIFSKFAAKETNTFLDVGCGDGEFTIKLAQKLHLKKIYGVDISVEAVKIAKAKKILATCLDVDEKNLPYPNNYFDFIYCGSLIELILDADHLLIELHRVLKKDGQLIITFPNLCSWLSRIAVFFGYLPYYSRVSNKYDLGKFMSNITKGDSTGFIRLFSLNSFKQITDIYKLKIVKLHGAQANGIPSMLTIFDKYISSIPSLAFQIIAELKK